MNHPQSTPKEYHFGQSLSDLLPEDVCGFAGVTLVSRGVSCEGDSTLYFKHLLGIDGSFSEYILLYQLKKVSFEMKTC